MGKFDRGNRPGGDRSGRGRFAKHNFGGGFGGGHGFGGGARHDRSEKPQLHSAICSDCGKDCEVPFKPTGERPVFCNDCFRKQKEAGGAPKFGGGHGGDRFARPSFSKPAAAPAPVNFGQFKEQLEMLNNKLDKILQVLNSTSEKTAVSVGAPIEKIGILSTKVESKTKAKIKTATKTKKVAAKKKK